MTSPSLTLSPMQDRRIGLVAAVIAALTLALGVAPGADARTGSFSITPANRRPYFILGLAPGATRSDRVRVTNVSGIRGRVQLFGVDATTGQTSGAVYKSQVAPRQDVGRWLALSTPALALGPHQSAVVAFTVRVPGHARPGQHLGGLVAAPVVPVGTHVTHRGKSVFRVVIHEIAVVGVEVNLPGPAVGRMEITGVSPSGHPGYQSLLLGLTDAGETLLKGTGRISVQTAAGRTVLRRPFALDTFVPRTSIRYPLYLRHRLAAGRYRATVKVAYGHHQSVTRTFAFSVGARQLRQTYGTTAPAALGGGSSSSSTPVWLLALGGVVLIGAGVGGSALYFRSRIRRAGTVGRS